MNNFIEDYCNYIKNAKKLALNLDISDKCPLQCPFCFRQDESVLMKEKIKNSYDIPLESFVKLCEFSSNNISLCGQISDPIYHPKFIDMIKIMQRYSNIAFTIHTTGTRKKLNWWKEVFSFSGKNIKWIFGLDGTDQETANIYRVNTLFDDVISVMTLASSMGVNVEWQFIVFKHNEHQIDAAIKIAKDINVSIKLVKSGRWPTKMMDKYKIYPPSDQWVSKTPVTFFKVINNDTRSEQKQSNC